MFIGLDRRRDIELALSENFFAVFLADGDERRSKKEREETGELVPHPPPAGAVVLLRVKFDIRNVNL